MPMLIECPAKALLAAVKQCLPAVASRTTKPVLAGVHIDADHGTVSVSATDLEVSIRTQVADVGRVKPGSAVIPADRLAAILAEAGGSAVTLEADADGATVRVDKARYTLATCPAADFPTLTMFDPKEPHFEIVPAVLAGLIGRTAFAASKSESVRQFATCGILFELTAGEQPGVRLVATDTKRLAIATGPATPVGEHAADKLSQIVPLKVVSLLERSLGDGDEPVRVILRKNELIATVGGAMMHGLLQVGRYPPYEKIVPKKHAVSLPVPVGELLARVRQAAIMTDAEAKRVDCRFEKGKVTLTARGAEVGSSEVVMPLPAYDGPAVEIAFDPQYLTEMFRAIGGASEATLEMTDGGKPASFRVGDGYQYLVMPLVR